jgi:hypothetical protein
MGNTAELFDHPGVGEYSRIDGGSWVPQHKLLQVSLSQLVDHVVFGAERKAGEAFDQVCMIQRLDIVDKGLLPFRRGLMLNYLYSEAMVGCSYLALFDQL